jgi:hypothetical protein
LYQDKRKARVYLYFFTVPFDTPAKAGYSGYVNVAKSSVKGLSKGAPLLKNDRFGDPSASLRFTDARDLGQHKPVFQFALLHA